MDRSNSASTSTSTFTSAYRPKHRDASAPRRRRGSESVAESSSGTSMRNSATHTRSRTEDHGRHPLHERGSSRSHSRPGFALGLAPVEATRPGLYRMLSSDADISDTLNSPVEEEPRGRTTTRDEETTVLVHQVSIDVIYLAVNRIDGISRFSHPTLLLELLSSME